MSGTHTTPYAVIAAKARLIIQHANAMASRSPSPDPRKDRELQEMTLDLLLTTGGEMKLEEAA